MRRCQWQKFVVCFIVLSGAPAMTRGATASGVEVGVAVTLTAGVSPRSLIYFRGGRSVVLRAGYDGRTQVDLGMLITPRLEAGVAFAALRHRVMLPGFGVRTATGVVPGVYVRYSPRSLPGGFVSVYIVKGSATAVDSRGEYVRGPCPVSPSCRSGGREYYKIAHKAAKQWTGVQVLVRMGWGF